MARFIIDSWAWMEYLEGSGAGGKVRDRVVDSRNETFTHVVSIAEITSKVRRRERDVESAWRAITALSRIITLNEKDAKDAGVLHASVKEKRVNFSLADAFILHAARKIKARVLTGDPDFTGISEALIIR
jgi:predicted nucleic acid-binding protein